MDFLSINYKTKKASVEEIDIHLKECKDNFNPPLEQRVIIREYSQKIFEKAVTFEAWTGNILVGLVAAYFNDSKNKIGYISSVSLVKAYKGMGIASELMKRCLTYAKRYKFKEIKLEVHKGSNSAIRLYKKFGFRESEKKDDRVVMKLTE